MLSIFSLMGLKKLKWIGVGLTSTLIDFLTFGLAYRLTALVVISNFLAALLSISFNYISNYFFTFNPSNSHRKAVIRYLLFQIITFVLTTWILNNLIKYGYPVFFSKMIIMSILIPISFSIQKFYIYKHI